MPGSSDDHKRDLSDQGEQGDDKRVRVSEEPEVMEENVVEIAEVWRKEMEDSSVSVQDLELQ